MSRTHMNLDEIRRDLLEIQAHDSCVCCMVTKSTSTKMWVDHDVVLVKAYMFMYKQCCGAQSNRLELTLQTYRRFRRRRCVAALPRTSR